MKNSKHLEKTFAGKKRLNTLKIHSERGGDR